VSRLRWSVGTSMGYSCLAMSRSGGLSPRCPCPVDLFGFPHYGETIFAPLGCSRVEGFGCHSQLERAGVVAFRLRRESVSMVLRNSGATSIRPGCRFFRGLSPPYVFRFFYAFQVTKAGRNQ
jgi:hypothetical protein